MAKFRNGDELAEMLRKALQIELNFEQESQWEGYFEKEKLREVLMELIVDSGCHGEMVQEMLDKVQVTPGRSRPPLHPRAFNFRSKNDLEMMMEIGKTERLMRDIYASIRDLLQNSGPGLLVDENDKEKFMNDLELLIKAETHHAELVTRYVGKI